MKQQQQQQQQQQPNNKLKSRRNIHIQWYHTMVPHIHTTSILQYNVLFVNQKNSYAYRHTQKNLRGGKDEEDFPFFHTSNTQKKETRTLYVPKYQ